MPAALPVGLPLALSGVGTTIGAVEQLSALLPVPLPLLLLFQLTELID